MYRNKNNRQLQKALKETFRTPVLYWSTFFDRCPWLVKGAVLDPSAGDARMTLDILARTKAKHTIVDIRKAETKTWKKTGLIKKLGEADCIIGDFLFMKFKRKYHSVITNPPFSLSQEFTIKGLTHVKDGGYVVMLQKLNWLGTVKRSEWLSKKSGLKYVYVITKRIVFEIDGREKNVADTQEYAFFVFQRGYTGEPKTRWLFFK